MKFVLIMFLLFTMISTSYALAPDPGWREVDYPGDNFIFTPVSGLEQYDMGVQSVMLLEIMSGDVSNITVTANTYTTNILIAEPSLFKTTLTVTHTNETGNISVVSNTFTHYKLGPLTTPIYIVIGDMPDTWGIASNGINAKTYREIDPVEILSSYIGPGGIVMDIIDFDETPLLFSMGWDNYYNGFVEPPFTFQVVADGPLVIRYRISSLADIYTQIEESKSNWILRAISNIPYVGPITATSLEVVAIIAITFLSILWFAVINWAIIFLMFETFVLAHAIMMVRGAETPLAGIIDAFMVIATDNLAMLRFVIDAIVLIIGWFIQIATNIKQMIPIIG